MKLKRGQVLLLVFGGLAPILFVFAAMVVRARVFGVMQVPQFGMFPTYVAGSRVFVSKWRLVVDRGQVVVFPFPERPEADFMQRVIAKDGDRLEVRDGHPSINGWAVPFCDVGDDAYTDLSGKRVEGTVAVEYLEGHTYLVFFARREPGQSSFASLTAKPGEMLVLGDNRNNSYDSRSWFGGKGGGVTQISAVPWSEALLKVPERLRSALDACLAKRPATTTPPKP